MLTQGLSIGFMLAVPLSPTFAIAGGVYIAGTFMMNVASPLGTSLTVGFMDQDERGAAVGFNAALTKLPNSVSTVIGSSMMKAVFLELLFYLASALYVTSISMFWVFFRKAKAPGETQESQ